MSEKQKKLKARLLALARKRKFKKKFREEEDFPGFTRGEVAESKVKEKQKKRFSTKQTGNMTPTQKRTLQKVYKADMKDIIRTGGFDDDDAPKKKRKGRGGGAGIPNRLLKGGLNNFRNRIK